MKLPSYEWMQQNPPTEDEATLALNHATAGKLRRSIPVQADDDDVVLERLLLDWKRLRAPGEDGYRCPACAEGIVLATCDRCHETWIGERAAKALDSRASAAPPPPREGEDTCECGHGALWHLSGRCRKHLTISTGVYGPCGCDSFRARAAPRGEGTPASRSPHAERREP